MIELYFSNNILTLDSIELKIESLEQQSEEIVALNLVNNIYNFQYIVVANEVKINGVLQTSAQMIIDTLSNGQS